MGIYTFLTPANARFAMKQALVDITKFIIIRVEAGLDSLILPLLVIELQFVTCTRWASRHTRMMRVAIQANDV